MQGLSVPQVSMPVDIVMAVYNSYKYVKAHSDLGRDLLSHK